MPRTRSGEPIHRDSRARDTFESAFWRPKTRADGNRLVVATQRWTRSKKAFGARSGPVGHVALDILRLFVGLQCSSPVGRLDCSYLWMAKTLRRSIDAVWRGLGQLRDSGILEWERRVRRAADQAWEQDTNAYRLLTPEWLLSALPEPMKPKPLPDDFAHASAAATASNAEQVRELPHEDWARTEFDNPLLAAAMARFRRAHTDSVDRNESPLVDSMRQESGVALPGDNMNGLGAPAAPSRLGGGWTARPVPT